jgi:hypothetical protein
MPGSVVSFVAEDLVTVPLTVLMPDGSVASQATIGWTVPRRGGGGGATWHAEDPVVQMEPGDWSVSAELGKELRSEPVAISAGVKNEPLTLRLIGRNTLAGSGRLDPADSAWRYVHITLRRRDPGADDKPMRTMTQAPDWGFRFEDLELGEYELSAGITEYTPLVSTTVRVTGGRVVQNLTLPRLTSAQVLEVRVLGPTGAPAGEDDLSFGIYERRANGTTGQGVRPAQRADGTFLIALVTPSVANRERMREHAGRGGPGRGGSGGVGTAEAPIDQGPAVFFIKIQYKGKEKDVEYVPGSTARVEVTFE